MNYLPAQALSLLLHLARTHTAIFLLSAGGLVALIYGVLRWRFARNGGDLMVFATAISVIVLWVAACVRLIILNPGYRVL